VRITKAKIETGALEGSAEDKRMSADLEKNAEEIPFNRLAKVFEGGLLLLRHSGRPTHQRLGIVGKFKTRGI